MSKVVLAANNLSKSYGDGEHELSVLRNINLSMEAGSMAAIVGSSGCGKSTLLHLLGGLDSPTQGQVFVHGQDIHAMSEKERSLLRNKKLGFIYQFHHLLPEFTALENTAMPLLLQELSVSEASDRAYQLLKCVGLEKRIHHKVSELSGGEKQRTAIARALVTNPSCVLADEPTGNLDRYNAEHVLGLMLALQESAKTSFIIVTHDEQIARRIGTVFHLIDGNLHQAE